VNRLGGKEWKHTKEKVRGSVREMAGELLRLYAEREKEQGYAFSPDSEWQKEMEAGFPYEETPDQLEAIRDIKADMERSRPMDRLLCGDVGYGKTEVALRAAFKAVLDGKQVAVLVPTTVLAQQHERTFRERLERFGVRIGVLSRFKTKKEIDRVLEDLAFGEVDIVIGTHMLFNKRVVYHDLGLLIIDEEQRFGVAHKEKIKSLKKNIDVLAMSATPIPRTLHMSLVGVRDISIIETPPQYRQPVKTYVMEYQSRLIQEAIEREMARGGQIYYVHNCIEDMESVAAVLHSMVPEAEILIGHGQMGESRLEDVMMRFMRREADILLCTTIVESGLDLPNVNTLILDGADRYGLSQMYQIRGRVGRSRRQAYAYFFYPRGKLLNVSAQKRLAAVRDYTDLGSGFKIAMRDMEIRGAGNILGAEQSGHMMSVGFDMYCRLINEEVQRLSGAPVKKEKEEVSIDILCSAYLPEEYVGDRDIKIAVYKRISEITTSSELKACMAEMEDRFGSIPDPVYYLFLVIRLKLLAETLGVISIVQKKGGFTLEFDGLNNLDGDDISALFEKYGRHF
ncbi:MAG: transcription-repair coupling factor, partial [Clostridia bacterium]